MMKQVCWHSRPRPARGTHGRSYCGRNRLWGRQHVAGAGFAETTPYGNLECGRAKSGRRDLMGSQRVARPSLERGMEAASGQKRTPQHEGVTEGRGGNGRKPPPPIQCATHPIGHTQGGLLSITLYFSNAGNASAAIFWWFLASAVVLRKGSPASAGASAGIRACVGRYVDQNGWFSGPCLATLLPRLIEIARACNHSSWFKFSSLQYPLENYKLRNMVRFRAILCLGVPIQCQRLQFYRRPWCQRFYRDFMAPLPCENTSAAWQLFFTARTWAKPHRLDSSVTLLLRRVVQSKTQWHSNVLKLLQKSSQALKTFFQLLQIKRLQLKLTNTLQNSYQIQSQHQVPWTWVRQHPKTPQTTKTNENPSPSSSMHKLVPFGSKLVPTWFL